MEVIDGVCAFVGMWQLSGELEDVKREECQIFNSQIVCLNFALQINEMAIKH